MFIRAVNDPMKNNVSSDDHRGRGKVKHGTMKLALFLVPRTCFQYFPNT